MKNFIVKKDFLNLIAGDEISISTDSDRRIYFTVENRTNKERFYGDENGRWGVNNPLPKNRINNPFVLVDEFVGRKNLICFGYIPPRPKHPTKETCYADNTDNWNELWVERIINDLKNIGVL